MSRGGVLVGALLVAALASGQSAGEGEGGSGEGGRSVWVADGQSVVSYDIEVTLDPQENRLRGRQELRWINTSPLPTDTVSLLLALNAFAGPVTNLVFQTDAGTDDDGWGWIQLTSLSREPEGIGLLRKLELVPDENNPADLTVARVRLPDEVPPGTSLRLALTFEALLPRLETGTGCTDTFYKVADWYPRVCQLEAAVGGEAGWSCPRYRAAGGYPALFGSYRVAITVPHGWVIGASGIEVQRGEVSAPGTNPAAPQQRVVFRADRVHDFAWVAAPAETLAVVESEFDPSRDVPLPWLQRAGQLLQMSAAELELPPIYLRLLLSHDRQESADRILRATRLAMAWYGLWYGPYPYPQLTLVLPPAGAEEAVGTGAPALAMARTGQLPQPPWQAQSDCEETAVLEIGRQYFTCLSAPGRADERWLGDGLARYSALSCLQAMTDDGLPQAAGGSPWGGARLEAAFETTTTPRIWQQPRRFRSEARTALALRALELQLKPGLLARALRLYAQRSRHNHATTADDLLAVLSEVAGEEALDHGWFVPAARDGAEPDWGVGQVSTWRLADGGYTWNDGEWRRQRQAPDGWGVKIDLQRHGALTGPVAVALTFADGSTERRIWDSRERRARWGLTATSPLTQVVLDPDGVWMLETRRHDNYWRAHHWWSRQRRPLWWIGEVLRLLRLAGTPWS